MAKREAALSGGDGGIVSIATCKDLGHKRIEVSVVASESEAIERHGIFHDSRIPCSLIATLAMLARNDMSLCHCEHS